MLIIYGKENRKAQWLKPCKAPKLRQKEPLHLPFKLQTKSLEGISKLLPRFSRRNLNLVNEP